MNVWDESDPMNKNKRLFKSEDPVFAGVCGGIAEYFDFDPTLVRILAVILVLAGFGVPIIAYIVAMLLMPKRTPGYSDYIDVKPAAAQAGSAATASSAAATAATGNTSPAEKTGFTSSPPNAPKVAQATAEFATASPATANATPGSGPTPSQASAPGSAYTACHPQAYDCHSDQSSEKPPKNHGLRSGITLGILLVGVGVLALIGAFVNVSVWRFWPLFLIIAGFVTLCTPSKAGWSLERAGHGISTIAVGFVLQLWMFGLVGINAFFLTFFNLWPILLVVLGLSIIGGATEQSIFKLLASLLFSLALIFGIWNFGNIGGPLRIDLPGENALQITIPSLGFIPDDVFDAPHNR
jgi:phage shock protein PspC (stress-responsive transcriptional regulator)